MKPKKLRQRTLINKQSDVAVVLVGIISQYSNFYITKPQKKTSITRSLFRIHKIDFGQDDIIDVLEFVRRRETELIAEEVRKGLNEFTAKRRMQESKRWEIVHLLMDIGHRFGWDVETTREENCGFSGDTYLVQNVRGKRIEIDKITQIADNIRTYVYQKLGGDKEVIIERGELEKFVNVLE
ncbi:hypothetical protein EIN_096420 [Entamoeba invadens IP1]|uniref:Uncharacterized protein n=1 Tax=Entamoeba invadens IP1 TaxID=370355 RepID=A0A0A1U0I0_ENTIV|nr:hypothetical protein EIN_096420 [Entamoeba invadens IP1]ELP87385.1 hypothetical protein EIN_096420 [Entamoeba invadens IP1]|eukprot:XP_004254156.1 hypothetical protein EIN_096420 [Entamoeba invadens IP1]